MEQVRKCLNPVAVGYKEPKGRMWEIYKDIERLHKWHHYPEIYEELLAPYLDRPIKLLEIGVYKGGSLEMWEKYLHPDSVIVGVDIEDRREGECGANTHFRLGDQNDEDFRQSLADEFGPFDVIIDDGSHFTADQINTFIHLFKDGLADEGLYVVEDIHTSYLAHFINSRRTFVGMIQQLIDLLHAEFYNAEEWGHFDVDHVKEDGARDMEYYEAWIHSIQVFDSIAAFKKRLRSRQACDKAVKDD